MKFLYVDVEHRKVVALFRNTNEEIIKLNLKKLQKLSQKERYVFNSKIVSEVDEALYAVRQYINANKPWWKVWL